MEVKQKEQKTSPHSYCVNVEDPMSGDNLSFLDTEKDVILIFDEKKAKAECYERDSLVQYIKYMEDRPAQSHPDDPDQVMRIWKTKGDKVVFDPQGKLIIKLPIGNRWVYNYDVLKNKDYKVYHLSPGVDQPIGSSGGVSRLHGAIYKVSEVIPDKLEDYNLDQYYNPVNIKVEQEMQAKEREKFIQEQKEVEQYQEYIRKKLDDPQINVMVQQVMQLLQADKKAEAEQLINSASPYDQILLASFLMSAAINKKNWPLFDSVSKNLFEPIIIFTTTARTGNVEALGKLCQIMKQRNIHILRDKDKLNSQKFQEHILRHLVKNNDIANVQPYLEQFIKCGANPQLILNYLVRELSTVDFDNPDQDTAEVLNDSLNLFRWLITEKKAQPNLLIVQGNLERMKYYLFNIEKSNEVLRAWNLQDSETKKVHSSIMASLEHIDEIKKKIEAKQDENIDDEMEELNNAGYELVQYINEYPDDTVSLDKETRLKLLKLSLLFGHDITFLIESLGDLGPYDLFRGSMSLHYVPILLKHGAKIGDNLKSLAEFVELLPNDTLIELMKTANDQKSAEYTVLKTVEFFRLADLENTGQFDPQIVQQVKQEKLEKGKALLTAAWQKGDYRKVAGVMLPYGQLMVPILTALIDREKDQIAIQKLLEQIVSTRMDKTVIASLLPLLHDVNYSGGKLLQTASDNWPRNIYILLDSGVRIGKNTKIIESIGKMFMSSEEKDTERIVKYLRTVDDKSRLKNFSVYVVNEMIDDGGYDVSDENELDEEKKTLLDRFVYILKQIDTPQDVINDSLQKVKNGSGVNSILYKKIANLKTG